MTGLHRLATLVAVCTLGLVVAGGLVTSTGAGLSVPDWPSSLGRFVLAVPYSQLAGSVLYGQGHRIIAVVVGLLTIILAGWIWATDRRGWMRGLGAVAVIAILVQALLGGRTVLEELPAGLSVAHAGAAHLFFALTVALALLTSRGWLRGPGEGTDVKALVRDRTLFALTLVTPALVFAEILLGATMRHTVAARAIPDFPLSFGSLVPSLDQLAAFPVAIHFAHRVAALGVMVFAFATAGHVWYQPRSGELKRPAGLLVVLVILQMALGGLSVLTLENPVVSTGHVVAGALMLATLVVLALRVRRPLVDLQPAVVDARETEAPARAPQNQAVASRRRLRRANA